MRVPLFEAHGWSCNWDPREGTHTFKRDGQLITVRSNAAWKKGMPPLAAKGWLLPRFWFVDRTWRQTMFRSRLKGFGNLTDGGEVGGGSIDLHPQWYGPQTLAEADGLMERHPIAAFHYDTGRPLTRADLGWEPYFLDGRRATDADLNTQLYPFRATPPVGSPYASWARIDAAHLIRAFGRDVASYEATRDIVARMRLIVQGFDVLNAYPTVPLDGWLTLGTMRRNVALYPHLAKLGTIRWLAWCIRAVAEAYRVCPNREFRTWLIMAVELIEEGQAANGSFGDFYYGDGQEQELPWTVKQPGYELLPVTDGEAPSWQMPFMVRAVTEAAKVVRNQDTDRRARQIITRFCALMRGCPTVPSRYNSYPGLPYWLITSRNRTLVPWVKDGIGNADSRYEPDVWACAVEMGVELHVPGFYDRVTTLEDSVGILALRQ